MYYNGFGVPQDDAMAASWYRKAAEQDYDHAQFLLGRVYEDGLGVPQDYATASSWYRKAADQGDAYGQDRLGHMHENGQGAPQDHVAAHMWFNLAVARKRKPAKGNRERVAAKMTRDQIAEAEKRFAEWPRDSTK
jgi:uncharacterized protein